MEIGKRMVLSQWSLADACMSALSWVLLIDVNWIAARMPHQVVARLARHETSTSDTGSCMFSSTAKIVQCSAHSCPELEQAT